MTHRNPSPGRAAALPTASANVQISIVTPMHNEELCVREFVRRVDTVLSVLGRTYEIVAVSDGSTDGTEAILRELAREYPALRAICLSRNVGQCTALYAGIQHSRGASVIVMDADLQHLPEEIPLLVTEMDKGFALVSGSRAKRQESLLGRRLPSRIANWLLRRVTGCTIRDMGGFKCIRGDVARSLRLRAGQHRLLPAMVHLLGGSVSEVTVSAPARFAGKSHYGIGRSFDVFFDILMLWFQASNKSRPLYTLGRIGLLLVLADCVIMPILLWDKFVHGEDLGTRPPFLIAIMFFLAAIFIFIAAFTLELLSDALNTVGRVPGYIVREELAGAEEQGRATPEPVGFATEPAAARRLAAAQRNVGGAAE
ncbi:MAG: glycosyltransferase family 2 protein [Phycisphaerales bacterium]|nr:glycosyltransferase family 2 protein [Phycisphaerales bacterium]